MSDHDHDDEHIREHDRPHSGPALRAKALESLLVEKGLVDPKALDELIDTYEKKAGPRNGARIVARAWADPAYRKRLLEDATAAIAEFGFIGRQGEDMVALENRTRPGSATWSCARYAPAIRGRCSGRRPSGTSPRRTARAPSSIRAAC
jgi:hypothetical protein